MVKPEFIQAAKRLKKGGIDGVMAAVDATANKYNLDFLCCYKKVVKT